MTPFAHLAALAETLSREASRLKKRAAIAASVGEIAQQSLPDAGLFCLYLAGEPFPETDVRKLNVGGALLSRAIKDLSGCTDAALATAYRKHGDMGAAAFDLLPDSASGYGLTLDAVAESFNALATSRSTAQKLAVLKALLSGASPLEAKYLVKLMLGDMRIGVKQSLIEEAVAVASTTNVAEVRHAVMLEGDLAGAVTMAFQGTLQQAHMRLFHSLGFMLASPVDTPEEAIARFTEATDAPQDASATHSVQAILEDKYDGMRAQVHFGDTSQPRRVAIYSRNREDITQSFPEIAEALQRLPPETTQPTVLDGELLAWDFATGKALPFSVLGQRIGRKRVDAELRRRVPAVFMAFDLLCDSGDLLLSLPLRDRRARLEALISAIAPQTTAPLDQPSSAHPQQHLFDALLEQQPAGLPRLMLSPAKLVLNAEEIDRAYTDARARANEGVMLKAAASAYQPGRRGLSWVKLKRELATLDVVITGAEFGHGRRAGLLSDYTFAVRGNHSELLNVGKAYSGVTDAEIDELTAWLTAHTLEEFGHFRTVEPLRVLEVAFNNIMRSDRHASGFALRFPRILRIRDDKPVEEIDTLERVEAIYQSQPDKGLDKDID